MRRTDIHRTIGRRRARQAAFTLVEVLVALVVFALLSIISYRTLSSILDTRERLGQQSATLRDQALFFTRLETDLGAILPRSVRNADGVNEPALKVLSATVSSIDPALVFSRTGFAGGAGAGTAPQRVGYRLHDGKLELLIWDGLDAAPRAQPAVYTALRNVREWRWRVLDQRGNWRADWPSRDDATTATASTALPAALELTLTGDLGSAMVRVFALRDHRNVGLPNG